MYLRRKPLLQMGKELSLTFDKTLQDDKTYFKTTRNKMNENEWPTGQWYVYRELRGAYYHNTRTLNIFIPHQKTVLNGNLSERELLRDLEIPL
jgi:hypothetical protein